MGFGGAFSTGLSGLDTNSRNIDIVGDNIANVNTPAFKAKRAIFASQFPRNFSLGSPPDGESGGTNPTQIGLGSRLLGTQTNFNNGGVENTGIATHMALEGDGFFVLENGGDRTFTRDGQFQLNSENELVTATGTVHENPAAGLFTSRDADPMQMAATVSHGVLGIRMKCAQCHNHPYDDWTQKDFYHLAAYFGQTKIHRYRNEDDLAGRGFESKENTGMGPPSRARAPRPTGGSTPKRCRPSSPRPRTSPSSRPRRRGS